jgi:hypothetical protein
MGLRTLQRREKLWLVPGFEPTSLGARCLITIPIATLGSLNLLKA